MAITDTIPNGVRFINADVLTGNYYSGETINTLSGNVMLEHKDMFMECDSAFWVRSKNNVKAFGAIHILQQPCTHIWADSMHYFGNSRDVIFYGDVVLTDDKMTLHCPKLTYNMNSRVGTYVGGGTVQNNENTLTSDKGYYYGAKNELVFKGNVYLINPQYEMNTDTLKYNLDSKIAYFRGATTIAQGESSIYCERGWYDTQNNKALFGRKTYLYDPPNELYADTMQYDKEKGIGRAFRNVYWVDNENKVSVKCFYGEFNQKTGKLIAGRQVLLSQYQENDDTLLLQCDTLISSLIYPESKLRKYLAYANAKLFKEDLQAIADTLTYSNVDSVFHLYRNAYIWSDSTQINGSQIHVFTTNNKPSKVLVYGNAGIVSLLAYNQFQNQIKGDTILSYITNNDLQLVKAQHNAACVYFAQDALGKYIGANTASSSFIDMYFDSSKVEKVVFKEKPIGVFYTAQKIEMSKIKIEGLEWQGTLRPPNREWMKKRNFK